jgi:hypothetical protein
VVIQSVNNAPKILALIKEFIMEEIEDGLTGKEFLDAVVNQGTWSVGEDNEGQIVIYTDLKYKTK